jgi:hypothetical protein
VKDAQKVQAQKMYVPNVIGNGNPLEEPSGSSIRLEDISITDQEAESFRVRLLTGISELTRILNSGRGRIEGSSTQSARQDGQGSLMDEKGKHRMQQELIFQEMMEILPTVRPLTGDFCVCEFGCGKGGLAARVMEEQWAWDAKFLLVDREPRRNKKENKFKEEIEIVRLRMDICDLDLGLINQQRVFTNSISEILIITKHLCGVATDLALLSAKRSGLKVRLCMAPCCHHACDWELFVGRGIFKKLGIAESAEEFAKIRSMSGWATSGRASHAKTENGRLAKTAIDLARCVWIMENVSDIECVRFREYVSNEDVTLENKIILAS